MTMTLAVFAAQEDVVEEAGKVEVGFVRHKGSVAAGDRYAISQDWPRLPLRKQLLPVGAGKPSAWPMPKYPL